MPEETSNWLALAIVWRSRDALTNLLCTVDNARFPFLGNPVSF
jgi:hypothetical protein